MYICAQGLGKLSHFETCSTGLGGRPPDGAPCSSKLCVRGPEHSQSTRLQKPTDTIFSFARPWRRDLVVLFGHARRVAGILACMARSIPPLARRGTAGAATCAAVLFGTTVAWSPDHKLYAVDSPGQQAGKGGNGWRSSMRKASRSRWLTFGWSSRMGLIGRASGGVRGGDGLMQRACSDREPRILITASTRCSTPGAAASCKS
jgi:hypothetical protein